MVTLGLAGVLAAVSVPVFLESSGRNHAWATSELIGAQIRQSRLKAISQNTTFQVRFNCPGTGQFRSLVMTGNAATDNAVTRCGSTTKYDSGVQKVAPGVSFGTVPTIQVNGRGVVSVIGGAVPLTISVAYGNSTRTLTVSATGQITFSSN